MRSVIAPPENGTRIPTPIEAVNPRIAEAVTFMRANLGRSLSVGEIAGRVRLSASRLSHLFRLLLALPLSMVLGASRGYAVCAISTPSGSYSIFDCTSVTDASCGTSTVTILGISVTWTNYCNSQSCNMTSVNCSNYCQICWGGTGRFCSADTMAFCWICNSCHC